MREIYLLLILFISSVQSQIKNIVPVELNSIPIVADEFIGFDSYDNCYYLSNMVLFKKHNDNLFQYQNPQLGKIKKVDILNPLKIIVFYEDFNTVVVLDNQLNEIQKISFSDTDSSILASCIGIAGQNRLWIYNTLNQQIGLFDLASLEINSLNIPIKEKFNFYQTNFNTFYWFDIKNNLNACDIYGKVSSIATDFEINKILAIDSNLALYQKGGSIFIKDFNSNEIYKIINIEKSFEKIAFKNQILSIFTNNRIINYKITIP